MTDYTLLSKARDVAVGAFEVFALEASLERMRENPEAKLTEGWRAFAKTILERAG